MEKIMKTKKALYDTLVKAKEHLEYCGYGDAWERECSGDLEKEIDNAIELYEKETKGSK